MQNAQTGITGLGAKCGLGSGKCVPEEFWVKILVPATAVVPCWTIKRWMTRVMSGTSSKASYPSGRETAARKDYQASTPESRIIWTGF